MVTKRVGHALVTNQQQATQTCITSSPQATKYDTLLVLLGVRPSNKIDM